MDMVLLEHRGLWGGGDNTGRCESSGGWGGGSASALAVSTFVRSPFLSVFCLSLPFSPLPPLSVCGLITAQTFNSDGNWNNNTGRILLALLLQLASGSYE